MLVLTRSIARPALHHVTVATITSSVRGIATEVPVGRSNGLDHDSAISCDNVWTIPASRLGKLIGHLHESQEPQLARALIRAYDLQVEELP